MAKSLKPLSVVNSQNFGKMAFMLSSIDFCDLCSISLVEVSMILLALYMKIAIVKFYLLLKSASECRINLCFSLFLIISTNV